MVLSPKSQGLKLSTDGLQPNLAQPPQDSDVALFLHTSGVPLTAPSWFTCQQVCP